MPQSELWRKGPDWNPLAHGATLPLPYVWQDVRRDERYATLRPQTTAVGRAARTQPACGWLPPPGDCLRLWLG